MAYNADEEIRRLKQISAKKPIIKRGLPDTSEGRDGDVALCLNRAGLGLYVKFNNRWYKFGEGKQVATGGSAAVDLSMRTDTSIQNLNVNNITVTEEANLRGTIKGSGANDQRITFLEDIYLGTTSQVNMMQLDGSAKTVYILHPVHSLIMGNNENSQVTKITLTATLADSVISFLNAGAYKWTIGNDHSDSHKFKINQGSSALADSSSLSLDTLGNLEIAGDLQVNGNDIAFDAAASTIGVDASAEDTAGQALTISAGDTTAGTSNDIAGGSLIFQGGQGKGSGAGGSIVFSVADGGSSGSSLNSLVTALTIDDNKDIICNGGPLYVKAPSGGSADLFLIADDEEDNPDIWRIRATDSAASNVLSFSNKISGSQVTHFTISPHATVTSSNAIFAGNVAVNGTSGITSGAVIWHEWVFNTFRGVANRYYYRDQDDLDDWRRWDAYSTLSSGDIVITTQFVSGHFVVPENCTLKEMHGQVYNAGSTVCPTISVFSGPISDSSSLTAVLRGDAQPNSGSVLVSNQNYAFSKDDFDYDLTAGDIVLPTVHYGSGSLQSYIGCLTLKFITR